MATKLTDPLDAAFRAAVDATNEKFEAGAATGDASVIASCYADDAQAFPPNGDVVTGRAAVQAMWQAVLDAGIAAFDVTTTEVDAEGTLGYETGLYTMTTADGGVADRGKYCVVWKYAGGQWLLYRDIWSTSLPETKG